MSKRDVWLEAARIADEIYSSAEKLKRDLMFQQGFECACEIVERRIRARAEQEGDGRTPAMSGARELIDYIEDLGDDGSEGTPWSQDQIDLILLALRSLPAPPSQPSTAAHHETKCVVQWTDNTTLIGTSTAAQMSDQTRLQPLPKLRCEPHERPRPSHFNVYDVVVLYNDYKNLYQFTESLQRALAASEQARERADGLLREAVGWTRDLREYFRLHFSGQEDWQKHSAQTYIGQADALANTMINIINAALSPEPRQATESNDEEKDSPMATEPVVGEGLPEIPQKDNDGFWRSGDFESLDPLTAWCEYSAKLRAYAKTEHERVEKAEAELTTCIRERDQQYAEVAKRAAELAALRPVVDALQKIIQVDGEKFKNWPRFWPEQDEQGGCVLCGAGTIRKPATKHTHHDDDCPFRVLYEYLDKREEGGKT